MPLDAVPVPFPVIVTTGLVLEYPPETPIIPPIEISPFFCAVAKPHERTRSAAQAVMILFINSKTDCQLIGQRYYIILEYKTIRLTQKP